MVTCSSVCLNHPHIRDHDQAQSSAVTCTLINVEFVHETEDLLGEIFGLELVHAVLGHKELRELPVERQVDTAKGFCAAAHIDVCKPQVFNVTFDPYFLIFSTVKLGWHQESSSVTRCFSK